MALPRSAGGRPIQDVKVFGVQHRAGSERNKRPWIVRWAIDGRQRSKAFRIRAEAERFRSFLLVAIRDGERFDPETGVPVSWLPSDGDTRVHEWAARWLAEQWFEWAPRTRDSATEALARFVPLVVDSRAPAPPPGTRAYLVDHLRPSSDRWTDAAEVESAPGSDAAEDGDSAVARRWLDTWCLPLSRLERSILAEVDQRLGVGDDGQPLAASTAGRYRKVARACIRRAVDLEVLPVDPWPPVRKGRSQRKALRARTSIDVRRLPDPATMEAILAAIPSHQPGSRTYQVMTAVAYYGGLRPSEVVMLRPRSLALPSSGWGRIDVVEADISFDEPGEPKTGPRSVPIPPQLVDMLGSWITEHGIAADDLMFRTRTGKRPTASNWARALQRASASVGAPSMRVYDCRHAAATTWLLAGVPLGEAARRLGHGVETLVSTYVGALAGDEELANARIAAVLGRSVSDLVAVGEALP